MIFFIDSSRDNEKFAIDALCMIGSGRNLFLIEIDDFVSFSTQIYDLNLIDDSRHSNLEELDASKEDNLVLAE